METALYQAALFFLGSFVSLFSIVDPLLVVPVFALLTEHDTPAQRVATARKASWCVFGILTAFFVAGGLILTFFGISIEGIRIAGGLMIVGSAFAMMERKDRLSPSEQKESEHKEDIAFSPLAMPMLSGPGAIAVIIGMTTDVKVWWDYPIILLTIAMVSFLTYLCLRLSHGISSRLSKTTMRSFTRIMGFILLCVGVQYIVNGVMPLLRSVFAQ